MDLIRDVLDKQLIDRNDRAMGKIDGIIVELDEDGRPQITYIEVGGKVLARRPHPALVSIINRLLGFLGANLREPFRIPWSKVMATGIHVKVDLNAEETPALTWELWLREHVVGRIPGA